MKMKILFIIFTGLLFSCSKARNEKTIVGNPTQAPEKTVPVRALNKCLNITPLGDNGNGTYTAQFGPAVVTLFSPYYQAICDDGTPVVLRNGLPAWTSSFSVDQGSSVLLAPNSPVNGSNQFVIASSTLSTDWTAYQNGIQDFLTAWNNYVQNGSGLLPYVIDYLPQSNGNGITVTTGKLIRITTGSKFALAPVCYPEPRACPLTITPL